MVESLKFLGTVLNSSDQLKITVNSIKRQYLRWLQQAHDGAGPGRRCINVSGLSGDLKGKTRRTPVIHEGQRLGVPQSLSVHFQSAGVSRPTSLTDFPENACQAQGISPKVQIAETRRLWLRMFLLAPHEIGAFEAVPHR